MERLDAIVADRIEKSYGATSALCGISLHVAQGEIFGLLGLNGAGKTTTIRILTTADAPTRGRALVEGHDVLDDPTRVRRCIGVVQGENVLGEPSWSPLRYLRYFGELWGIPRDEADARARDLFTRLACLEYAETPMGKLSAGTLRKAEIARALLHHPRVLFLDEPTRELDIPSKEAAWRLLRELADDGVTVFLTSHDPQEIGALCGRIGILRGGRMCWQGRLRDLEPDPERWTAALASALVAPPHRTTTLHEAGANHP